MICDRKVKKLMKEFSKGHTLKRSAALAGMDEKTARKYLKLGKLPSACRTERTWRTRVDPFEEVWPQLEAMLREHPTLEAKTLFEWLQLENPGRFQDGQLRTLQRRIKQWRGLEGPPKEVFFEQVRQPGEWAQSDFTSMDELAVTINGEAFPHLLYHFVLPYSNWETGSVCFSESFESLSDGLQKALYQLGGAPLKHQSDRLSAASNNHDVPEAFTRGYHALTAHYNMEPRRINPRKAHENGDVEQSHARFKNAVDQHLMLRGSRDFSSREDYEAFLGDIFSKLNANRRKRFAEEQPLLQPLAAWLDNRKPEPTKVSKGSTISVRRNLYSVHSRLIGETVRVIVEAEVIKVYFANRLIETLPRLRGRNGKHINYRHIIDWLVRKPGAFENYRHREELFPSSIFRMAYDALRAKNNQRGPKTYLKILRLAARESQSGVETALHHVFKTKQALSFEAIERLVNADLNPPPLTDVFVKAPDLTTYDLLISNWSEEVCHA